MNNGAGAATHKFVVVLNKKLEAGAALNAAAHMAASIVCLANDQVRKEMMFIDYSDADGNKHPASGLSLVVLRADNSNKIRQARAAAIEKQLLYVDFLESMTGNTYVEQQERTMAMKEDQLEYWGLCLFGKKEDIDAITGKFSLWRSSSPSPITA